MVYYHNFCTQNFRLVIGFRFFVIYIKWFWGYCIKYFKESEQNKTTLYYKYVSKKFLKKLKVT